MAFFPSLSVTIRPNSSSNGITIFFYCLVWNMSYSENILQLKTNFFAAATEQMKRKRQKTHTNEYPDEMILFFINEFAECCIWCIWYGKITNCIFIPIFSTHSAYEQKCRNGFLLITFLSYREQETATLHTFNRQHLFMDSIYVACTSPTQSKTTTATKNCLNEMYQTNYYDCYYQTVREERKRKREKENFSTNSH